MKDLNLIALVIIISSCGTLPQETSGVAVSYDIKNFRLESPKGCKSEATNCAYYEVNYPVFSGLDSAVSRKLQREIELSFALGDPEADDKSMQQIAEEFLQNYEEFTKESPGIEGSWSFKGNVEVNVLTDTLISLTLDQEYYTGGAHGGMETYFININPKTGKDFTLDNFFKPGYKEPLTMIGEKAFRKERELSDTASFKNNYFEFPDDKFELNQNYGFTQEGMIFYYNNYEIAPYAAGPTQVFIPYEEIKRWIKD